MTSEVQYFHNLPDFMEPQHIDLMIRGSLPHLSRFTDSDAIAIMWELVDRQQNNYIEMPEDIADQVYDHMVRVTSFNSYEDMDLWLSIVARSGVDRLMTFTLNLMDDGRVSVAVRPLLLEFKKEMNDRGYL